jgi:acetyltransferase-like isoleucine patch superfamily enzyme
MARALLDGVAAALFCILVGVPATAVGFLAERSGLLPNALWWRWALLPPLALLFLVGLLLTAAALRLLLPGLKPGHYPFPGHRQAYVWLLHFSLQRLMYLPLWRHFLFSFSTLRWALLRALGAKAAYDMDTSADVLILDLPLMELGAGTMIGAGCTLSGHVIESGTLFLDRVRLDHGVQVGSNVLIGPGASVGEHATIGPDCRLGSGVTIGPFAYLGVACALSPGVRVGANAMLGHQVNIEPAVTIGEGAVVRTGARVPRGTTVADGSHYPPESLDEDA